MAKVMDLIKRFYSTFIRYFLIKLVFLYVYKWIQSRSTAVYICKEEYFILLILLNWRRLLAQIYTIRPSGRQQECLFSSVWWWRLFDSWRPPNVWNARSDGLRTGFGPHTNDLLWYFRLKETQTAISLQTPNAHLNHALSFLSFFFLHISVFLPCV